MYLHLSSSSLHFTHPSLFTSLLHISTPHPSPHPYTSLTPHSSPPYYTSLTSPHLTSLYFNSHLTLLLILHFTHQSPFTHILVLTLHSPLTLNPLTPHPHTLLSTLAHTQHPTHPTSSIHTHFLHDDTYFFKLAMMVGNSCIFLVAAFRAMFNCLSSLAASFICWIKAMM